MSLEQEQIVKELDSDIIGNQIGEAVSSLNPGLALIDKASWYVVWATVFGGAQVGTEAGKILLGTAGDKFPQGWESFNVAEEFLEGSIPAVAGAFAGKKVYELICSIFKWKIYPGEHSEVMFMLAGAGIGYGTMMQLGALIEKQLGIPDIKWGPFK